MTYMEHEKLHIVFLPYMAPGHMMPMLDIAKVFTSKGNIKATIITTPANARRLENDHMNETSGDDDDDDYCRGDKIITFFTVNLPLKEVGLPEGCENLVYTSTRETTFKLIRAIEMIQPQLETLLIQIKPDCIVSDYLYPWTVDVANRLGIPRLAFSGGCFFNNCVCYNLERYRPHDRVGSDRQGFVVPSLPDSITLTSSQLQDIVRGKTKFNELFEKIRKAERNSFGVLMNSFYELEGCYADYFENVMGIKSWHVGPLFLFNKASLKEDKNCRCLHWLDSKPSGSVLYICFGSITRFTRAQIEELAIAVLDSGCFFIWVLGKVIKSSDDEKKGDGIDEDWWLPDWFEEKVTNIKGLVIKGWAPQAFILQHRAVGGFLTHCGWNSILEGICAGVPLVTWPMFADQFYNEKLVTQVLKIGVEVGNMVWKAWATDETEVVMREKIKSAITRVMEGGEEGIEMRRKVAKFSELAHKAIEEGGSSYNDIKSLLNVIRLHKQDRIRKTIIDES